MKKTSKEEAMQIFFEMCDFGLENYISVEMKRFPDKSIKQIIIEMHDRREKLRGRKLSQETKRKISRIKHKRLWN